MILLNATTSYGTSADRSLCVLQRGELFFDETLGALYVGDGSTKGGIPAYVPTASTLQAAYDQGSSIALNDTQGAITLKDAVTPLATMFGIYDETGATDYFSVASTGIKAGVTISGTGLNLSGGLTAAGPASLGSGASVTGNVAFATASDQANWSGGAYIQSDPTALGVEIGTTAAGGIPLTVYQPNSTTPALQVNNNSALILSSNASLLQGNLNDNNWALLFARTNNSGYYGFGIWNGGTSFTLVKMDDTAAATWKGQFQMNNDGTASYSGGLLTLANGLAVTGNASISGSLTVAGGSVPSWKSIAPSTFSMTGSPFSFQNTNAYGLFVSIQGTTGQVVSVSKDNVTFSQVGTLSADFVLPPGWYMKVTYTTTPTNGIYYPLL